MLLKQLLKIIVTKMQQQLLIKFAEILNEGSIIDDLPSWIGEVQISENTIKVRIDDDYADPKWYSITIAPVV